MVLPFSARKAPKLIGKRALDFLGGKKGIKDASGEHDSGFSQQFPLGRKHFSAATHGRQACKADKVQICRGQPCNLQDFIYGSEGIGSVIFLARKTLFVNRGKELTIREDAGAALVCWTRTVG